MFNLTATYEQTLTDLLTLEKRMTRLEEELEASQRLQDRYRQREQELLAIFDQMFAFVGILSANGRIEYANQPTLRFRQQAEADIIGKYFWETVYFDISEDTRAQIRDLVGKAAQGNFVRQEVIVLDSSGKRRVFDLSLSPLYSGGEATGRLVAEGRDITEQKNLEEQLRHAQKMEVIGQLSGGVAHDFNNLLTIITGYSEMLLEALPAEDPFREQIEEISKASYRSGSLTRQLLMFSRQQKVKLETVALNEVVRHAKTLLQRICGEDVKLSLILDESISCIDADGGQLEQVLLNLAVNARDAMPHGGELNIETREIELDAEYCRSHLNLQPGQYVLLAITDSGVGMTKEIQQKVFEPFFTTKSADKGTGLGLSVVHGIVKNCNGHCAVYSEPGLGTTFKLYFPVTKSKPSQAVENSSQNATVPRGTETVLLVEDDDGVREFVQRALKSFGYNVLVASCPHDGIQLGKTYNGPIDLILTDLMMPQLNGRRMSELLQSERSDAKILYMSGYTDDAVVRQGIMEADVNFLHKPFTPAALALKVRDVLDHPIA